MFSKKAKKIDEISTVDLTLWSKCQIDCSSSSSGFYFSVGDDTILFMFDIYLYLF